MMNPRSWGIRFEVKIGTDVAASEFFKDPDSLDLDTAHDWQPALEVQALLAPISWLLAHTRGLCWKTGASCLIDVLTLAAAAAAMLIRFALA